MTAGSARDRHRHRPRVLVTVGSDLPARSGYLGLATSYVDALVDAGANPVLVPTGLHSQAADELVAEADGLLLPGGVDPHPRHFDESIHHTTVIDENLDSLEFAVIDSALHRGIPILGICRGSQILNVALGGSLIQHLPDDPIDHRPDGPLHKHIHRISFAAGSRLRRLAATPDIPVNSWHHQAIARIGAGLRVAAVADDGVIEAVEATDPDAWIVGVQYHPEELTDEPAHRGLFESFVHTSRDRSTERGPQKRTSM